jgi:hypothetical protein
VEVGGGCCRGGNCQRGQDSSVDERLHGSFCCVSVIRLARIPGMAAVCHRGIEAAKSEAPRKYPLVSPSAEVSSLYLTTNDQYGPVAGELLASVSFV